MIRNLEVRPFTIEPTAIEGVDAYRLKLQTEMRCALARQHPVLKAGSTTEFVYRRVVTRIQGEPPPEMPEMGNGVAWMRELEMALTPLMPRLQDRNRTRVRHYLVYLHIYGLLDIDESEEMVSLPRELKQ